MAMLKVREVFPLPNRREVVIAGDILDGTLKAGMSVRVGRAQVPVKAVEYVDRPSSGVSLVGLVVAESDSLNAVICSKACPVGSVVQVSDAA